MAPIQATVYELERRRCNLCGQVFTASAPEGVGEAKYDVSVAALLALLRYGAGLPMNRLERLQLAFGIPMPVSTQWDLILKAADLLTPAYAELTRQAAQGEVLYNDDTVMRILEKAPLERKATYTSSILSRAGEHRIALFITGHHHAGENLEAVLKQRAENLSAPIQMCDALAANMVGEAGALNTVLAHCLAHARRRFVEVENRFPEEVEHLLGQLKAVYRNDARAKREGMDPQARLAFHQRESGPVMAGLEAWLQDQIEGGKVEPNSGLGQAIAYMRKHWKELTLFLREPGAPLDNNLCEASAEAGHHAPEELPVLPVGHGSPGRGHVHEPDPLGGAERGRAIRIPGRAAEARRGGGPGSGSWMPWTYLGGSGFGLTGAQNRAALVEPCALKFARNLDFSERRSDQAPVPETHPVP